LVQLIVLDSDKDKYLQALAVFILKIYSFGLVCMNNFLEENLSDS